MKERKCEFEIVAFVDGERREVHCNPDNGCLRKIVWSGIGMEMAAAQLLGRVNSEGVETYVSGDCVKTNTDQFSSRNI